MTEGNNGITDPTQQAALNEAAKAGITSPAGISDTRIPTAEENGADIELLKMRVERAEALIDLLMEKTGIRNVDIGALVETYRANKAGSEKLADGDSFGKLRA